MLKPDDCLVLTKPLGTGVLLAALMQCKLPGFAYKPLVETMLQSNYVALRLIERFQVAGITDVTGFGLAGHLAEMLRASQLSAEIEIAKVPVLPSCQSLVEGGVQSTLAPDNRLVAQHVHLEFTEPESARHAVLFDPQTSGGLLFGVGQDQVGEIISFLAQEGFDHATVVGTVRATTEDDMPTLTIS